MSKLIKNCKIKEISNNANIKEIIEEDVGSLKKESTNNYSGFHKNKHASESKTSLKVNTDKGVYYCFNCGEGGNAITWLMANRSMGFLEAAQYLAARYDVDIGDLSEEELEKIKKFHQEKEMIYEIFTIAAEIYNSQLREEHYHLLKNKWGITKETADSINIGYAPSDGNFLLRKLLKKGYSQKDLKKTGLFIKKYDFFQGRIIFPYQKNHKVVFFIGRKTKHTPDKKWERGKYKKLLTHSDKRKYISSVVKNEHLFGVDSLSNTEALIITEGITDAITTIQAGYSCISPVTVQFRKKDYKKLESIAEKAKKIYIVNDNEESGAGRKGALETARYLHKKGHKVYIVELPKPEEVSKIDLADYWKDHNKDDFEKLLRESNNLMDLGIKKIKQASYDEKITAAESVYPLFAGLGDIEKDRYIKKIKEAFGNDVRIKTIRGKINEVINKKEKKENTNDIKSEESTSNTSPIPRIRESSSGYFYVERDSENDSGEIIYISNFILNIDTILRNQDGKEIISGDILYYDKNKEEINLDSNAFILSKNFKEELPNKAIWTGNSTQLQQIKVNIYDNNPVSKKAVELAGRYDNQILLPEITLSKNGIVERADKVVINLKNNHLLSKMPKKMPDQSEHMRAAENIYKYLPRINEPVIAGAITSWSFALPWCDLIRNKLSWGGFPHLILYGEAGSGKTQSAKLIWRLNGISQDNEPFSLPNTRFTRLNNYSSSNLIPVFLDEYRPSAWSGYRSRQIHEELRNIYNKNAAERGRADLTTKSFSLAAPIILCGEDRPRDTTGLEERMIILNPNKDIVDGNNNQYGDICKKNFNKLQKAPLEAFALPYWKWSLAQENWEEKLEKARGEIIIWKEDEQLTIPERLINNLAILKFGWWMYLSYAEELDIELDEEILIEAELNAVLKSVYYNVMPEGRHFNEFDELIVFLNTMVNNSKLYSRIHYTIKNKNTLILRLPDILPIAKEFAHKTQRSRELLGIDAYRSIIRRLEEDPNSYVLSSSDKGSFRKSGDSYCELRGVALDMDKLEEQLKIEQEIWS
ncbi:CHC2 zinc finger domain-containing protein [Halanaerobium hydrogeniformans]|uniref:DNA primase catalytic core domain n=1 Tax=Halanaerobium hydrogeniformans TaxID=656519 RepID=E4RN96_HALHG|nr:CHC2 zinc finger domain-containing protein [Halanaerobium hydrogeniformans]ADQ13564.1 DNA primase catalytic core domain [Halanaerobium hydrogeniformans]